MMKAGFFDKFPRCHVSHIADVAVIAAFDPQQTCCGTTNSRLSDRRTTMVFEFQMAIAYIHLYALHVAGLPNSAGK
jgi:hypothetical protein